MGNIFNCYLLHRIIKELVIATRDSIQEEWELFHKSFLYGKVDEFCKQYVYQATVDAMKSEGRTFKGVLFFGLMLTKEGLRY